MAKKKTSKRHSKASAEKSIGVDRFANEALREIEQFSMGYGARRFTKRVRT